MQAEVRDIVEKSLKKAREHEARGDMGRAYAYYTVVIELCPEKRKEVEKVFTDVLCEWGLQLIQNNRTQDVIVCYEHSLDIYPENPRMLNNFAAHLLRLENPIQAIKYLKRALKADPNFLLAERNLQNAYSMAVDRWHFSMLNDRCRNRAFKKAIRNRIREGYDTVLDIGTGTGLLSLYARDAGAKAVYACECSPVMAGIAEKVFARNSDHGIKLISELSTDLRVPKDIPERVKLIVTETFDAGLFGEFVVPSMIDAHVNLLAKNSEGIVIPMWAALYVAAVESEHIRLRSSIEWDKSKRFSFLNFENVSLLPDDEYYDSENLENVKINYITEPKEILRVHFNDVQELQEFTRDGIKGVLRCKCRYDGVVDGLVAWFKLHLDETVTIDSSQGKSCWQLAVFSAATTSCQEGDELTITAEVSQCKLKCSYVSAKKNLEPSTTVYRVPKEVIAFLNDSEFVNSLVSIGKSQNDKSIKTVLDTSPFPVYGLTMAKTGRICGVVYHQTDNEAVKNLVRQVVKDSGIKAQICIISDYRELQHSIDSVLVHNFDVKGELKDWGLRDYDQFFSSLLSPVGTVLQKKIFLMGQLVFSSDLAKMVRVKDSNLSISENCSSEKNSDEEEMTNVSDKNKEDSVDYFIAEYINEYKINQVFDLNSSLYQYEPMSDVNVLIKINEAETTESLVNFGRIKETKNSLAPNALVCWYRICLSPEHVHDTRRDSSFMNHTAIVLEDELKDISLKGGEVNIKVLQMKGLVKVSLADT
ncbi:protein arginine N-methyltransferase 9 [Orussus abietinus]|uniref:protein arginine N-methyltransferase 9 n=1 Tax=Orussus abietinus TaxID=222816 RepID=UPI00062645A1|nr:protein arginine N-methyltransferase 9 [Orussus abietinus]XP_012272557.1 protein arginine N-methyltransferase 9 [Orussus abietinus]